MATKPWPTAKTLAAPLNDDGAGGAVPAGAVVAGVEAPGTVPVAAGAVELPATGYGVATAALDVAAAVDAGAELAAEELPAALEVVAT